MVRRVKGWLLHENVWVRFAALWTGVAALFVVAWAVGYAWLPEGILRHAFPSGRLAGGAAAAPTFVAEWLRIVAVNFAVAALFIGLASFMRTEDGYPLAYLIPPIHGVLYGVLLGTNSFSLALPGGKLAPSLDVLGRAGPHEITAYVLLAASLYGLARYQLVGRWWSFRQQLVPRKAEGLRRGDRLAALLAVALILASGAWEAHQVLSRVASD